MGSSSAARSLSVGQRSAVPTARSGWKLRQEILGGSAVARYPGSSDRAAIALAEPLPRAADRIGSTRVSGSRDCAKRIRSAPNPQIVLRILRHSRTHLSLGKDAPIARPIQPIGTGAIIAIPQV